MWLQRGQIAILINMGGPISCDYAINGKYDLCRKEIHSHYFIFSCYTQFYAADYLKVLESTYLRPQPVWRRGTECEWWVWTGPFLFLRPSWHWCHTICVLFSLTPRTCVFNDHRGGIRCPFYFFLSEKRTWVKPGLRCARKVDKFSLIGLANVGIIIWNVPLLQWCQFFSPYSTQFSAPFCMTMLMMNTRSFFFMFSLWVGALLTLCLSVYSNSFLSFCYGLLWRNLMPPLFSQLPGK